MSKFSKKLIIGLTGLSLCGVVIPVVSSTNVYANETAVKSEQIDEEYTKNLFELSRYVDKYVVKNGDKLELLNETEILEYIFRNLDKYVDGKKFKNSEDVLYYLKELINNFNNLAANPAKKINENKELVDRYSFRLAFDHSDYSKSLQWFGIQHIFYTDRTAKNFAMDLKDSSHGWGALGIASFKAAPVAATFGGLALYLDNLSTNLERFVNEDSGQGCVLNISWVGYYEIFRR